MANGRGEARAGEHDDCVMAMAIALAARAGKTDGQGSAVGLGDTVAVRAIQQIRKMRGGAQSHLMLGEDGNAWVVKFQNNPQHLRVLPNELLATRLAALIGLTVPACDVVEVSPWLIERTPELEMDLGSRREPCRPGLHFGSQLVGGLMPGHVADYLPEPQLAEVRNLSEFAGVLALDKWTCNANGRQALFHRKGREKRYTAAFIDQGFCFNAGGVALYRCAAARRLCPQPRLRRRSPAGRVSNRG